MMGKGLWILSLLLVDAVGTFFEAVTMQAEATPMYCTNYKNERIDEGMQYIPFANDMCYTCTCEKGYSVACSSVQCLPPDCDLYEIVEDECCSFNCLVAPDDPNGGVWNGTGPGSKHPNQEDANSANLPLRLVASTVTSFLILALLLFMVHRLRQRRTLIMLRRLNAERQDDDTVAYLPQMDNIDMGIEFPPYEDPPPPYTPPKPPYVQQEQAPPPYDESTPDGNATNTQNGWAVPPEGESRQCNGHVTANGTVRSNLTMPNGNITRHGEGNNVTARAAHSAHRQDRNRNGASRRENGNSHARMSTGGLCTRSTNTERDVAYRVSSVDPCTSLVPANEPRHLEQERDNRYRHSDAVASLTNNNVQNTVSDSVMLRMENKGSNSHTNINEAENPCTNVASPNEMSSKQSVTDSRKDPPSQVSQFIKRSNSIEIRRESNSPRNSFYHSGGQSEDSSQSSSMSSSLRESPGVESEVMSPEIQESLRTSGAFLTGSSPASQNEHLSANGDSDHCPRQQGGYPITEGHRRGGPGRENRQLCIDGDDVEIVRDAGPSQSSYPLGWDPSTHTPLTDSSSESASEQIPYLGGRMLTPEAHDYDGPRESSLQGSHRQSTPPSSLDLPLLKLYSSQYKGYESKDKQASKKGKPDYQNPAAAAMAGPRPSYQDSVLNSPSSNARKSSDLPENINPPVSVSAVRRPAPPRIPSHSPHAHSPISPGLRPVNRSGSVTSQVSMFSVCSETGERKRPGLSLPPEPLRNGLPYPLTHPSPSPPSLVPLLSASPSQGNTSGAGFGLPTCESHNHQTDKSHDDKDIPETVTQKTDPSHTSSTTESHSNRTNPCDMIRTRPKIVYRDQEELELKEANNVTSSQLTPRPEEGATGYSPPSNYRENPTKSSRQSNDRTTVHKLKGQKKNRPRSNPGTLERHSQPTPEPTRNGHGALAVGNSPDRTQQNARKNGSGARTVEPRLKQYGFIDRPEVLSACKDNVVYPEAGDKVPNLALFEKLQHRSLSRERQHGRDDPNSSGYSSKSTGNDRSGGSSRSRSASRSRSRSRDRATRRNHNTAGNVVDNRRWSEPPNMNLSRNAPGAPGGARNLEHKTRSPRRRKKRRSHAAEVSNARPQQNGLPDNVEQPSLPTMNGHSTTAEPTNSHYVNNNVQDTDFGCSTSGDTGRCGQPVDNQKKQSPGRPPANDNEQDEDDMDVHR